MTERERGLVRALVEAIRPFASRLLDRGVPLAEVEAQLRRLWVETAERELAAAGTRSSDSRIALMTGIHRKEVRRLRSGSRKTGTARAARLNRLTALVGRWTAVAGRDDSGPRALPYHAPRGPSFTRLAREVTADLAPRVLLDELLRTGAARLLEGDRVELASDSFVPRAEDADKLQILAEDPAELVETMLRNVLGEDGGERLLQRKIYYDHLGRDAAEKIRSEARREGERFVARMNRLLSRYDRDRNPRAPGGERFTAGIGVYFYEDPPPRPRPAPPSPRKERIRAKRKKS